jgi:hypothetical protein
LNVVAFLFHAEVFKPYSGGFPNTAADTLYAESFAAQVLWAFDAGTGDEIEILPAAQTGDDFYVSAADRRRQRGRRAAVGDLGIAGREGGNLRGIPSHPDDLGLNAVLCEKILPLGDP